MAGDVLSMTVFRKFEQCASYQHLWYKSATTPSRKTLAVIAFGQMRHLIIGLILGTLFSCEGIIHIQGTIVDSKTNQPLDNVTVKLNDRTDCQLKYDSLSREERQKLRKQGIKDDYWYHDAEGLSKLGPSTSDAKGLFWVGNILVQCIPKCPTSKLTFEKEGYKPTTIVYKSLVADSLIVRLEKSEQ
jgi:hypothetical protein